MTLFRFTERRNSRHSTTNPPTTILEFSAAGSQDDAYVRAYAIGATPPTVIVANSVIYRQDVQVVWEGVGIAYVRVPYGPIKVENGSYDYSFDTTGGTLHIKCSKEHVATYPTAGAPNHHGAIGVNGDQVEGVDIVIPALKLNVHFTHPAGIITLPQIKNLARITGRTNSNPFLTFAPGEILFLGCSGSDGPTTPAEVTYQFACSENLQNVVIGEITVAEKKGWHVAWFEFRDDVDAGKPIKRPQWIHIERVYDSIPLEAVLGFGA